MCKEEGGVEKVCGRVRTRVRVREQEKAKEMQWRNKERHTGTIT